MHERTEKYTEEEERETASWHFRSKLDRYFIFRSWPHFYLVYFNCVLLIPCLKLTALFSHWPHSCKFDLHHSTFVFLVTNMFIYEKCIWFWFFFKKNHVNPIMLDILLFFFFLHSFTLPLNTTYFNSIHVDLVCFFLAVFWSILCTRDIYLCFHKVEI